MIKQKSEGERITKDPETHKGLAVQFYFDTDTELQIRAFRESIYQKGVHPVLGAMNDRPHISLAVFGKTDPDKLMKLVKNFAGLTGKIEIKLSGIGIFPTTDNVLFLIPVPSERLLSVHKAFHQELIRSGMTSSRYYLPGNWIPHCSIEFEISDSQLKKAIHLSKYHFTPISGTIMEIGIVAFRPIEYLGEYKLSAKD